MRKHSNLEALISDYQLQVEESSIRAAKILEDKELLDLFIKVLYFTDKDISCFKAVSPRVDINIPLGKDFMSYVLKHASEIKKTLAWEQVCKLNFQYGCLVFKKYLETRNWSKSQEQVEKLTLRELFNAKIES